ncbi:MAG: hypothetical protein K0S53_422 [Bacteroidetes bacterium]|jgi:hypothetical protein|nr:hypothetical protein [Bacteroidota bacterium]MDF2451861.1 hypothetical protein [Bacteroidota bacterium]
MNLKYFNLLDLSARSFLVYKFGELVSFIYHYGFRIHLVALNGVYLEVYKNLFSGEIEKIEVFNHENERLQLYAEPVCIKSLFQ